MLSKFLVGFIFAGTLSQAALSQQSLDVCEMALIPVPQSVTETEKTEYLKKISVECEIAQKYQQMQFKARQKWNLSLEQIAEYQALRYVRRVDFEAAKQNGTPVPVIYQLLKADVMKENSQKSSIVWDGFLKGIQQLDPARQRLVSGGILEVNHLESFHREFYRLSSEEGDYSNAPFPGIIKAPGLEDRFWWRLKADEVESMRMKVQSMNEGFAAAGLLPSGLDRLQAQPYQMEVLSVRLISEGSGYGIYSGDSRANRKHLDQALEFINQALSQARRGQHIVWNGRLYTPAELAWLSQQFFVAIHPFSEGNGRVSRLLQELVLTSFGLPHGSSGDMMEHDVLTPPAEYYRIGMQSTRELLSSVDRCLESVYSAAVAEKKSGSKREEKSNKPMKSIFDIPSDQIEYSCRILR